MFSAVLCAAGGTSGHCYGRASCEFSSRRDLLSAGSSHRVCDASSGGQHVAPALRIRSASTCARRCDTCTCEEVRGTFTSSDLGDTRAAVPCRVLNGSRHDRRKPGRHDVGNPTVAHYGCGGVATRENHGHLGLGWVDPQFSITAVETFALQVVGSLPLLEEFGGLNQWRPSPPGAGSRWRNE